MSYWASHYWHANYWQLNYWAAGAPAPVGAYWHPNYWHANYWHANYWANVVSHSGNAIGSINTTLDPLACLFQGTSRLAAVSTGVLDAPFAPLQGSFVASVAVSDFFDLSVPFTPNWHSTDYLGFAGSIDSTLAELGCVFVGSALAAAARVGTIDATFASLTADVVGTSIAPPNRAGVMVGTFDPMTALFQGVNVPPFASVGEMDVRFNELQCDIAGIAFSPTRTGSVLATFDPLQFDAFGVSVGAGTSLAALDATFAPLQCYMLGSGPGFHGTVPERVQLVRGGSSRIIKVRNPR